MKTVDFIILGAGPSGLAFAHTLKKQGAHSFLLIDREPVAGGLCRSADVDGSPLDIGGGHFLDVRRPRVLELLFQFLPVEAWTRHRRISTIRLRGQEIDYPLEANIWQLPAEVQADYLEAIARSGVVRGEPMPERFSEWIRWKLGDGIADEYMLPYNRKIWSLPLDELGTYWLEKLPSVSFRETLLACLTRAPLGQLPAHGEFFYPTRHGYGEVWRRMGDALGEQFIRDCPVTSIDPARRIVNGQWQAGVLVNTIPWPCWTDAAPLPDAVCEAIGQLRNAAIHVDYFPDDYPSRAHWIYEPDEAISYHRLLLRRNFCTNSRGYWTETNAHRAAPASGFRHHNAWAYPVNTLHKREQVRLIADWARRHSILPLGRWGKWEHLNSDVAVDEAIDAAVAALKEARR